MIGGYLSFAGIQGKTRYHDTPVETALAVTISPHDDRAERPEACTPPSSSPATRSWTASRRAGRRCSAATG
jgi:uncharacterized membrane protein